YHTVVQIELADTERRIRLILNAIEQGIFTASTKDRLLELEAQRDRLRARLQTPAEPRCVPRLHPNLAEIYRHKVRQLETALNEPDIRADAHAAAPRPRRQDRVASGCEARRGHRRDVRRDRRSLGTDQSKSKDPRFRRNTGLVGCGGPQPTRP